MRQDQRRNCGVVVQEIALDQPLFRIERLVEICELKPMAIDDDLGFLERRVEKWNTRWIGPWIRFGIANAFRGIDVRAESGEDRRAQAAIDGPIRETNLAD